MKKRELKIQKYKFCKLSSTPFQRVCLPCRTWCNLWDSFRNDILILAKQLVSIVLRFLWLCVWNNLVKGEEDASCRRCKMTFGQQRFEIPNLANKTRNFLAYPTHQGLKWGALQETRILFWVFFRGFWCSASFISTSAVIYSPEIFAKCHQTFGDFGKTEKRKG